MDFFRLAGLRFFFIGDGPHTERVGVRICMQKFCNFFPPRRWTFGVAVTVDFGDSFIILGSLGIIKCMLSTKREMIWCIAAISCDQACMLSSQS